MSELNEVFAKKRKSQGSKNQGNQQIQVPSKAIPFKTKARKPKDQARLVKFINTIAESSPFGKSVLEEAASAGYTLCFEQQKDSCGFCDPDSRMIVLNPTLPDNLLIATLAHEARHAQQFCRGASAEFGQYNVKSEIMYTRAEEADAETAAAATCHEIRINSGNDGPWKSFSSDSVEIATEFMNAASSKDAPVSDKMLQAAFNGWYKATDMVEAYEEGYIQDVMNEAVQYKDEQSYPYDKKISSADIVTMFCQNAEGKCYWNNNKDVLNEKEKLSVCAETITACDKFFVTRNKRYGTEMDNSYLDMPVRDVYNLPAKTRHHKNNGKEIANSNKDMKTALIAKIKATKIR